MSSFWMWRKANYIDFDSFRMGLVVALLYLIALLPLSLHDPRERGRDKYDYHSIDNQRYACDLTDLFPERKRLLSVDEHCQECHHRDIHDAKWKEEYKQEPAASETIGSVNEPHTESTTISITP